MDIVRILDHTSIAVDRIHVALPLFRDLLGGKLVGGEDDGEFRWVQLQYPGGGKIELLDPSTPDSFVRRFLERRGPGMHHITFKVHDVRAAADAARAAGFEVFGERYENPQWQEAFIHPRSAHGVLVQFAQSPTDEGDPDSPYNAAQAERLLSE